MKNLRLVIIVVCGLLLLHTTKSSAGENVVLAAFGQPSAPQLMAAAVAEPGSPVVGKTYQVTNDLHFTVGYRNWLNWWQTSIGKVGATIPDPDIAGTIIQITDRGKAPDINQFAAASIPGIGLRYKEFFASASVMISPDYHFSKTKEIVSGVDTVFGDPHAFRLDHKVTGSRNEVDVNLGYYVHPWVALTMGYKGVFQKFKDQVLATDITHNPLLDPCCVSFTEKSSPSYHGGTLGVAANVPIPEAGWIPAGFSLYGNGGGGVMGSNDFRVAFYGTIDAGLAYKPTQLPLLFTGGFKLQIINSLTKSGAAQNHILDYTRGMILGVNYVF